MPENGTGWAKILVRGFVCAFYKDAMAAVVAVATGGQWFSWAPGRTDWGFRCTNVRDQCDPHSPFFFDIVMESAAERV